AAYSSQTCAVLSMPAAVAINRTLFASRVVMKPMPTPMRRSTYCARTARCSLWRNTAASGPTKQEPSGGLLDAEHPNPRYSRRGGCQDDFAVGSFTETTLPPTLTSWKNRRPAQVAVSISEIWLAGLRHEANP